MWNPPVPYHLDDINAMIFFIALTIGLIWAAIRGPDDPPA